MDWYKTIFEVIDMRSFSNLWYWIALAVVWSTSSHWVIGVPFDLIQRAGRQGGQAETDLQDMVRININRVIYISAVSGMWLIGIVFFILTVLGVLGFVYWVEFCQAVFLLAFPLSIVGALTVRAAHKIHRKGLTGADLRKALHRHRMATQAVGMVAITVTALWGMAQSLTVGVI